MARPAGGERSRAGTSMVAEGGAALRERGRQPCVGRARDTARWAATQTYNPCSDAATGSPSPLLGKADEIATASSILGYTSGTWNSANFTNPSTLPANPPNNEGVEVAWSWETGGACPPADNVKAAYVTIRVTHSVPVLIPGLEYLPAFGTCDASGCHFQLTSTSTFRMEPPRQ